jgi:predicted metalloprotease with PDZ domain
LHSTEELDYGPALDWFGLRFEPASAACSKVWLGANTRVDGGRLVITEVLRDSPAWEAGLSAGDEIIGMQGYRVRPEQWAQSLEHYRPGERAVIAIARGERLAQVDLKLAAGPGNGWRLERDPSASPDQERHLRGWLGSVL